MNKFKVFYGVVIFLSIIMILTNGFSGDIIIHSYDDAELGIIDGFQGNINLSIINCCVVASILILTAIITFNKKNKINKKIILFVFIIILSLCIPVGTHNYSGGFAGTINEDNIYLSNIFFYIVR